MKRWLTQKNNIKYWLWVSRPCKIKPYKPKDNGIMRWAEFMTL